MTEKKPATCGLIMPISEIDGCSTAHWLEVKGILSSAIEDAGLKPRLVSDAQEVGVIQTRIIGNIYGDEIIVCDVSGRNPNVMFELGLRIAFDKPVVIVKDDITQYSFDTMPMEHVGYPRSLRYHDIVAFRAALAAKIQATIQDGSQTYLKSLGPIRVPQLETTPVQGMDLVLDELAKLRTSVGILSGTGSSQNPFREEAPIRTGIRLDVTGWSREEMAGLRNTARLNSIDYNVSGDRIQLFGSVEDIDAFMGHYSKVRKSRARDGGKSSD